MGSRFDKCDNCKEEIKNNIHYVIYINHSYQDGGISTEDILCSPSCLVEFAWKIKEGQDKLSKSKE